MGVSDVVVVESLCLCESVSVWLGACVEYTRIRKSVCNKSVVFAIAAGSWRKRREAGAETERQRAVEGESQRHTGEL